MFSENKFGACLKPCSDKKEEEDDHDLSKIMTKNQPMQLCKCFLTYLGWWKKNYERKNKKL